MLVSGAEPADKVPSIQPSSPMVVENRPVRRSAINRCATSLAVNKPALLLISRIYTAVIY